MRRKMEHRCLYFESLEAALSEVSCQSRRAVEGGQHQQRPGRTIAAQPVSSDIKPRRCYGSVKTQAHHFVELESRCRAGRKIRLRSMLHRTHSERFSKL